MTHPQVLQASEKRILSTVSCREISQVDQGFNRDIIIVWTFCGDEGIDFFPLHFRAGCKRIEKLRPCQGLTPLFFSPLLSGLLGRNALFFLRKIGGSSDKLSYRSKRHGGGRRRGRKLPYETMS